MHKDLRNRLLVILFVAVLNIIIALPSKLPLNINYGPISINVDLQKAPLDINVGNISIRRDFDLKFGLDLVGGSHFVYEAKTDGMDSVAREQAMESLLEVISRRVNMFGVTEVNIQRASFEGKDRIIIELPGVTDADEAKALIGATARLVFARLDIPEDELDEEDEDSPLVTGEILVPTELTGADISRAQVVFSQLDGKPAVGLEFTPEGARKFEEITEQNIGQVLPILLDGQVISAPVVQEKISGGSAQISGDFSVAEARELAIQINAGALPVEIELLEERTVGPTLGAVAIEKSVYAGIIGIVAVMLLMVAVYGRLGAFSVLGLFFFGVLTIAIYKLVPVVLTLPGIAGFLLSVGMSVDANILVFERFKEEKKTGSSDLFAIETAFLRAWSSIRDANVATLATTFILANPLNWSFLHTSGPVRGFAVTLALGVFISLLTGMFVSRNLLRWYFEYKQNG